jgi:hypothetical protein
MSMRTWTMLAVIGVAALGAAPSARAQGVRLRPLTTPIYEAGADGPLGLPAGVSCSADGFLVADGETGGLTRFAWSDDAIVPRSTVRSESIPLAVRAEAGPDGDLFVLVGREHRIERLAPDGTRVGPVSFSGADGDVRVRSFRFGPAGDLHVLDVQGSRILVASPEGDVSRSIAFPEDSGFVSDIAVDAGGRVLAIDSVRGVVLAASRGDATLRDLSGALGEELDFGVSLDVDRNGSIFVLDRHGGGVVVLDSSGTFRGRQSGWGWKLGRLRYPESLCVAGDRLVVSDRGNRRVQVFEIRE